MCNIPFTIGVGNTGKLGINPTLSDYRARIAIINTDYFGVTFFKIKCIIKETFDT